MRADLDLCFLERVGMPDVTALSAEQSGGEALADGTDRQGGGGGGGMLVFSASWHSCIVIHIYTNCGGALHMNQDLLMLTPEKYHSNL